MQKNSHLPSNESNDDKDEENSPPSQVLNNGIQQSPGTANKPLVVGARSKSPQKIYYCRVDLQPLQDFARSGTLTIPA